MRRARGPLARIPVLTVLALLLIFLGFHFRIVNIMRGKALGSTYRVEPPTGASPREDPFAELSAPSMALDPSSLLETRAVELEFEPETFFTPSELEEWGERASAEDLVGLLAPPIALTAAAADQAVVLRWHRNPRNEAVARRAERSPLLTLRYRVYRWRPGEEPRVIAVVPLDVERYLDDGLGPAGGRVLYSVHTALEGRVAGRDMLIESEGAPVFEVTLPDAFELRLLGPDAAAGADADGTPRRVRVELLLSGDPPLRRVLSLAPGDEIAVERPDPKTGRPRRLTTRLRVAAIAIRRIERKVEIRRPVFEADGSRAFDDKGFLFREEVRTIPTQRLEVRCEDGEGRSRVLGLDLP